MTIVYAEPLNIEPPAPLRRDSLRLVWEGVDGSRWALGGPGGVPLLRTDVVGLLHPAFTDHAAVAAAVDGQWYRSSRAMPRHVSFTAYLQGDQSSDYIDRHGAWWRSWSPRRTGRLSVASVRGTRSIALRLTPSGDGGLGLDPQLWAHEAAEVDAVADQPFWLGEAITRSWASTAPVSFFGPTGYGPDFYISSAATLASAAVTNPGDEASWLVWTVTARSPVSAATLSAGGGVVTLPAMGAGQTIRVDTDPATGSAQLGAMVGGVFVASDPDIDGLIGYDPRPLPPGVQVPVGIDVTGEVEVQVSFTPRYWLAF